MRNEWKQMPGKPVLPDLATKVAELDQRLTEVVSLLKQLGKVLNLELEGE